MGYKYFFSIIISIIGLGVFRNLFLVFISKGINFILILFIINGIIIGLRSYLFAAGNLKASQKTYNKLL